MGEEKAIGMLVRKVLRSWTIKCLSLVSDQLRLSLSTKGLRSRLGLVRKGPGTSLVHSHIKKMHACQYASGLSVTFSIFFLNLLLLNQWQTPMR